MDRIKSIRIANQNVLLAANNNIGLLYGELVPGHVRDVTQANTNEHTVQCESKKSPLKFSDIFSETVGNF